MIRFKKFKLNNKEILFVGTAHNPNKEKIKKIKSQLENFSPDIILIEGGFENGKYLDEEDSIKKGWEMGFVSFYANEKNIILKGNDPDKESCVKFIKELYGKDLTFLYFVLRNLRPFLLADYGEISRKEKEEITIRGFKKLSRWDNYSYSSENFCKMFKKYLEDQFDLKENYLEDHKEVLGDISKKLDIYRDSFMIHRVLKCLLKYNKIFIIKGGSHLDDCEKTFKELLDGK